VDNCLKGSSFYKVNWNHVALKEGKVTASHIL